MGLIDLYEEVMFLGLFICMSVCVYGISKVLNIFFLKFSHVGRAWQKDKVIKF